MKEKKKFSILKVLKYILIAIIVIVVGYVAYVFIDYHRIPDNQELTVTSNSDEIVKTNTTYKMTAYNIGFGAYPADYSFFMDGGKYSRAYDKETVIKDMEGVINHIKEYNPDFMLYEEVDTDSNRAWHVNEYQMLVDAFKEYSTVFAQNYDSPYLMYPLTKPHGKSKSGIATFGKFKFTSSLRRQLPIETSIYKLLDLDRGYSKTRIPTENGNELVLYVTHMSAYTKTGSIVTDQLNMILGDMQEEYEKGNYVIAGGDFNKDLFGGTEQYSGKKAPEEYTWDRPFPLELLEGKNLTLKPPIDENKEKGTVRNSDAPLKEDTYVATLDGFIVSDNVKVISSKVIDTGYDVSDHNPVIMEFELIK